MQVKAARRGKEKKRGGGGSKEQRVVASYQEIHFLTVLKDRFDWEQKLLSICQKAAIPRIFVGFELLADITARAGALRVINSKISR